ncbi:MAG: glycosyltransferase family 2 protein [Patescibacteria group bacterium]|nr:glycosyltransferase family 2 protein [Patescibacteria group bacterium]
MPKLTINLLGYNHRDKIGAAIDSVLAQSFLDYELWYTDNASADGSASFVRENYPQVKIFENEKNFGYAGGHNSAFRACQSELVMVLNPDVVLDKDFLTNLLPVFSQPQVAAATGKLLKPRNSAQAPVLDGTGIVVSMTRRARERGQNKADNGQYDNSLSVFGVSGTAAVYRRAALEKVKLPKFTLVSRSGGTQGEFESRPPHPAFGHPLPQGEREKMNKVSEYFDEDFFAYWEDFDLSWRLRSSGYACRFVPQAICYHERLAGSSPGGYKQVGSFIAHHRELPLKVKEWNWKNHLFCIVKNDFGWPFWLGLPFILCREFAMLVFILLFERETLKIWPQLLRQLPAMLKKRNLIKRRRTVNSTVAAKWFLGKYD